MCTSFPLKTFSWKRSDWAMVASRSIIPHLHLICCQNKRGMNSEKCVCRVATSSTRKWILRRRKSHLQLWHWRFLNEAFVFINSCHWSTQPTCRWSVLTQYSLREWAIINLKERESCESHSSLVSDFVSLVLTQRQCIKSLKVSKTFAWEGIERRETQRNEKKGIL
jgi:hypothetical protein